MDRFDFYFRQKVSEGELDAAFDEAENALWAVAIDHALTGIAANAVVTEKSGTPNLTVDVSGSALVYDKLGRRIAFGPLQNVDVSVDESAVSTAVGTPGNEKIVSLFAKFDRALTDPRIDGNSVTVFFNRAESFTFVVRQGSETASPPATPPALDSTHILLADIRRSNPQTQILNTDITPPGGSYTAIANRREDVFVASAGALEVREGTSPDAVQALLTEINNIVTGTFAATSITCTIAATWHDATGISGTDVDAALEEIVTDLAGTSGSDKVGGAAYAASLLSLAAGSVQDQIRAEFDRADDYYAGTNWLNHPDNGTDTVLFTLTGGGATTLAVQESLNLGTKKALDVVEVHYSYPYFVSGAGELGEIEIRITEGGVSQFSNLMLCDDNVTPGARDRKCGTIFHSVVGASVNVVVEMRARVQNAAHTLNILAGGNLTARTIRGINWP